MVKTFIKDFSIVFFSNCIGLLLSIVMNLILPIVYKESIESYGYIQLYFLYINYYFIFDFGLCSGIYLKEGGKDYKKLDFSIYSGQLYLLLILQLIIFFIVVISIQIILIDYNKKIIAFFVVINIILIQIRTYITNILQATNRMKEYAMIIIMVKLLNTIIVILMLTIKISKYSYLIFALTTGEFLTVVYSLIKCKEILKNKPASFDILKREMKTNILSGVSILISSAASMLMIGFARIIIENKWGIKTFAQVSFAISISNVFMIFINTISIILYPKLKNIVIDKQFKLYVKIRDILMVVMFICISMYYPISVILNIIFPIYKQSIVYMIILLPVCLYTSKMLVLIQNYMKVLRIEKKMMSINIEALIFAIILMALSVYILESIKLTIIFILISQIYKTFRAEYILSKILNISIVKDTIDEILLTVIFIISNWYLSGIVGFGIFIIVITLYIAKKRKNLFFSIKELFLNK